MRGSYFSNCSRSGSATAFRVGRRTSVGGGSGGATATAITSAISGLPLVRIARAFRAPGVKVLPVGLRRFQRRAEEVSLLIREAFLGGISTRQAGRVVATITGETVSAQTVSKLTRDLDAAVRQFHQARLSDDYAYLFLDGVSLPVRRPARRKQIQMLV